MRTQNGCTELSGEVIDSLMPCIDSQEDAVSTPITMQRGRAVSELLYARSLAVSAAAVLLFDGPALDPAQDKAVSGSPSAPGVKSRSPPNFRKGLPEARRVRDRADVRLVHKVGVLLCSTIWVATS